MLIFPGRGEEPVLPRAATGKGNRPMKTYAAAGLLLAAMTAGASMTPALAANPTPVQVELWNKADGSQGLSLSTDHAKAGKIDFEVKNSSTTMVHEFMIWKTDLAFDKFPKDPANPARVD